MSKSTFNMIGVSAEVEPIQEAVQEIEPAKQPEIDAAEGNYRILTTLGAAKRAGITGLPEEDFDEAEQIWIRLEGTLEDQLELARKIKVQLIIDQTFASLNSPEPFIVETEEELLISDELLDIEPEAKVD